MKIRTIAKLCNTTPAAIRLYEVKGLFDDRHLSRDANGYRNFKEPAIKRLRLITTGRQLGFTLRQMRTELSNWDDDMPVSDKKQYLHRQLAHVNEQLDALQAIRRQLLVELHKQCEEPSRGRS